MKGKNGKTLTLKRRIIQSSMILLIAFFSVAYLFIVIINFDYAVKQEKASRQAYEDWCKQELSTRLNVADKAISMIRVDENLLEMFQRNVYGMYYTDHYEKITDTALLRTKAQNICSALEVESVIFFIPYDNDCPTGLIDEYVYNDAVLADALGDKKDFLSKESEMLQYNYGLTDSEFWARVTGSVLHERKSVFYTTFYVLTNYSRTEYYGCVAISIDCSVISSGISALYGNSKEYLLSITDAKTGMQLYSNGVVNNGKAFYMEEYGLEVKQVLKTDVYLNAALTCIIIFVVMCASCIILLNVLSRIYKKVFFDINNYIDGMDKLVSNEVAVPQYDEFITISENFNALIEKLNGAIREKSDYEVAQKEAQLLSLQYQINPHFMFNMIEVFRMRLEANGDIEAGKSMKDFGQFLRYNLSGDSSVTLDEEIKMAERFIGLFRFKYGNRLKYEINLPQNLKNVQSIKFILQPIVENSIKYGFQGVNVLTIRIDCCERDEFIYLTVSDNGAGISPDKLREIQNGMSLANTDEYSIGLSNVYRRIKLFYGEKCDFSIESNVGEGTCVKIMFVKDYKDEDSSN